MERKSKSLSAFIKSKALKQIEPELQHAISCIVADVIADWENPSVFSLFDAPGHLNILKLMHDKLSPPLTSSPISHAINALHGPDSLEELQRCVPKDVADAIKKIEQSSSEWMWGVGEETEEKIIIDMYPNDYHEILCVRHFATLMRDSFDWLFERNFDQALDEERKNDMYIGQCRYCHRIFVTVDNRRHLCSHHSPKLNRKEYDRARKQIRRIDLGERTSTLSKACRASATNNDPTHVIDAISLFPECKSLLFDWSGVSDYRSLVQFVSGRLDAIDTDSAEDADALHSYLENPEALRLLIETYCSWHQDSHRSRKKPGRQRDWDPNLARSIRASGPRKKSYQRVADILADEHSIFICRQGVFNALRDQS